MSNDINIFRGIFMASDYTDSFAEEPYFIEKGSQLSAAAVRRQLFP
jgi:hypothetical protein